MSKESKNFGGDANKYILTMKELIVATIIPPKLPENKEIKTSRIATSSAASSYLFFSILYFMIKALNAVAIPISNASITYLLRHK
jgi:hypothetical protein